MGAFAVTWAALIHIRKIGTLEDDIRFLDSWRSNAVLRSVADYNAMFGKYGVHIDATTVQMPTIMETLDMTRRIVLKKLYETRECARNLASILVVLAGVAGVGAVVLFDFGL